MKNTLLFTYSTNILVRLLTVNMKNSYHQNPKKCDPILVTPLKMPPHYSQQSSRKNATPSSGTSPLAWVCQQSVTNINVRLRFYARDPNPRLIIESDQPKKSTLNPKRDFNQSGYSSLRAEATFHFRGMSRRATFRTLAQTAKI